MKFINTRLKIKRFFRKYKKIIALSLLIWLIIFLVNYILRNTPQPLEPKTTYTAHTSVMDSGSATPKAMSTGIEDLIAEYVGYCNEGNYQKAFNMLSKDCQEFGFENNIERFMEHVLIKMPEPRRYSIQDYSNMKIGNRKVYIYEVKYTEDFLATGLTGEDYRYTTEKFMFYNGDNGIEMTVGDFILHDDIKRISENDYFKVDVIERTVNYSIETYKVKITNKSNYTIVISDGVETDEVIISLPNEYRTRSEIYNIVLKPGETQEHEMTFKKFVDDGDNVSSLTFTSVRVMENYSGVDDVPEEVIQSEIDNAISKFSTTVEF